MAKPSSRLSSLVLLAAALSTTSLVGCGGANPLAGASTGSSASGMGASKGKVQVKFAWPVAESRVIPTASKAIKIEVLKGGVVVDTQLIAKPATTANFDAQIGTLTFRASATPNLDGTGTVMATAEVPATVTLDGTTNVDLTMGSTIDRLAFSQSSYTFILGLGTPITVSAKNAANQTVLMDPSDITWTTTVPGLTIDALGIGLAAGLGSGTITATDRISGKSATANAIVIL